MRSSAWLVLTGLSTLTAATPVAPPQPQAFPRIVPRQDNGINSTAPCAQVSNFIWTNPSRPQSTIPAKLAHDCLNSVPFNASSAKRLLQSLPPYIKWQSTLTVLKNPPAEYTEKVQPAVDILGGLDKLHADIDAGKFTSEYQFGWALYSLFISAHDGHLSYTPDSVGSVFQFGRPVPLVSVSEDGQKLPAVFAFYDVLGMQFKNISYTPSPVKEIDGVDVNKYLEDLGQHGSLQDRDALYNNVFYELAQVSLGTAGTGTGMFTGGGRGRYVYPGASTTLTFANGTSYTMQNYAIALQSFRAVTSGEELAERYFFYGNTAATARLGEEPQAPAPAVDAAVTPGYPTPVQAGPANLINGFFVDAPGYEDVAVLQIPNFVGDQSAEIAFQRTTKEFIPKALAAGKKKLIIDVQANGGGTILQGYDLFKQLFPTIDPVGRDRFRATEALDLIGQSYSAWSSKVPRVQTSNSTILSIQASWFDYHADMAEDGENFRTWDEKFGPNEVNGDEYTTPSRWNLSDVHVQYNSGGINITGYGPLANVSRTPPFEAENIVLLTDGYCASTCTIFSEFLTKQAGVKTIALGGRSNSNPIQAIGGVKGTNNYAYSYIQNAAQNAIRIAPAEEKERFNSSILRREYYDDMPFTRSSAQPGVNVRDGLKYEDDSGIALQFIYEEADCRLYYTPEMTVDITAVWKAAADARWGDGKCVQSNDGYGKRRANRVTRSLKPRRAHVSQAVALQQFEAFEKSFGLETQCHMTGDGFMHP